MKLTRIYQSLAFPSRRYFSTNLAHAFHAKVDALKELPSVDDNQLKLKMYALYKQATIGKCTTAKPGMFNFVEKAKWEAWNAVSDLSNDQAMEKYMAIADELFAQAQSPSIEDACALKQNPQDDSHIQTTVHDNGILHLHLNNPTKFNALNWDMYTEITNTLNESSTNPQIRALHLSGAGRMFCSGNDLSMFQKIPDGGLDQLAADAAVLLENFVDAFITYPKPIIVAVQGPAVGISVTILGLCDLVYASHGATFHTPFTKLGQSPEACSSVVFPEFMGPAAANAMLLMGEKINAQRAYELGLVTQVFGHDFEAQVQQRISRVATLPPQALQKSKEIIRAPLLSRLQQANRDECALLRTLWTSDECMQAIIEFGNRKT